jgi:hypothetical protein
MRDPGRISIRMQDDALAGDLCGIRPRTLAQDLQTAVQQPFGNAISRDRSCANAVVIMRRRASRDLLRC